MFRHNRMKFSIYVFVALLYAGAAFWAFAGESGEENDKPKRGSAAWYKNGPQKDWSRGDHDKYYNWREKVYKRVRDRLAKRSPLNDDQVLRRQRAIINGNKIITEITNFGSISSPGNRTTDIVWEGLGYGYEFGPFIITEVEVPAESHIDAYMDTTADGQPVLDSDGNPIWKTIIISDGLVSNGGEVAPDLSEFWGWEPLAFNDQGVPFADPLNERIPTSNDLDRDGDGKPDSWPEGWYNPNIKRYVWPGALRQGASNADLESFFVVDDRTNREFEYYPFPHDSSRKGLGIEIECRYYQWANPLAEDMIFLVYKITNKSPKDLKDVFFGMWGDPHVGGPSNWQDDLADFDIEKNMVFAWDEDGRSDVAGRTPGYFGYKFLESPGNPDDGIDNDGDGLVDESQFNGIDDDGDWDPEFDDVGQDGVANTGELGEGDGVPTAGDQFDIRRPGEPNFETTDLDESDQNGLTSFAAPPFAGNRISDDHKIFTQYMQPGEFDTLNAITAGDNIFLYGSGPINLNAGASRRFSIALIIGEDRQDLSQNADIAQQIFESNYQFAKPPEKPTVTAVPGDRKVTLYWDQKAETETFDPLSRSNDFEGYVIYRSTDPNFLDQQTITDAGGAGFLLEPLKTVNGAPAKWDLDNEFEGLAAVPFKPQGVFYNLGSNTGLQHSFVDSNNVINGQTYYYAVVSYDHGFDSDSLKNPPTECSRTITINPETNEVLLDINTVEVIPGVQAAGYQAGGLDEAGIAQTAGVGTGTVNIDIIDPDKLEEGNEFRVSFLEDPTRYTVEDLTPQIKSLEANVDQFVLLNENINESGFSLTAGNGGATYTRDVDYELDPVAGFLRVIPGGAISEDDPIIATYTYFPVLESQLLNNEEANPIFDGMKIFVEDQELDLDEERTGWVAGSQANVEVPVKPFNNLARNRVPADYEVRFSSELVDSSSQTRRGYIKTNFQVFDVTKGRMPTRQRIVIVENSATRDSLWNPGERVIILQGETGLSGSWEFTMKAPEAAEDTPPVAGDVFFIATTRPFSQDDLFTFTTRGSTVDQAQAASGLDDIYTVPNPYVVTSLIEPLDRQNPRDRGQRRMYFANLPQQCTIRIFTITGELVDVIEHDSPLTNGQAFWDLTTKDNFPVAYGVYVYHVDAGELGEVVKRFAIIK